MQTVQLDPQADLWIDVEAFAACIDKSNPDDLEKAVALYRGDFLEGYYDDWIITRRYWLDSLLCEALTRLMMEHEAADKAAEALSASRQLLERDPLREDAHRAAMRALCMLGQRNAALEQYRRCQEAVQHELGVEPMVETTELYQAILEGQLGLGPVLRTRPAAESEASPALPSGANPLAAGVRGPLVGRDQEMTWLQDRKRAAQKGQGALVLVSGEAGVGKTRLVETFAQRQRWQGVCVLWGRCYEFERILLYQPIAEALRSVVPTLTRPELEANPTWVLVEVARLVPEILEALPELEVTPPMRSRQERSRLFEGLYRFMTHLVAQGQVLLVLEDLHWAAESTLQLVHYLARQLASLPVLIVGTLRPEAVVQRHPLMALQQDLAREGLAEVLHLEPLSEQATETLVIGMSGMGKAAAPLARRLFDETEGNPLFLMETIKALFEAGLLCMAEGRWAGDLGRLAETDFPLPTGVSKTIQSRVCRLDEDTQQALRLAAVLGREFDTDLLAALWGRSEEATLEALETLLRRRLIEEGRGALGRDYAFTHHKIQEAVYAGIPDRVRERLHGRAGIALERLYGPSVDDMAGELAFHFQAGAAHDEHLRDKAVQYLLQAGDQARWAQAHQDATEYYRQALAWLSEQREHNAAARTLMKLGLTYYAGFEYARAREAYDEGFVLWQRAACNESARRLPPPQTLRSWQREPATLDPGKVTDWHSGVVLGQLFSSLIRFGTDMEVLPEAANRWHIVEEGRRYVFHLKRDARWSDGVPVTAYDFEYAWKRFLHPSRGLVPATSFYNIKGARAYHQGEVGDSDTVGVRSLDDFALVVDLENPDRNFLHLTRYAMPVPRHLVEVCGDDWTTPGRLVSNGPFKLESWQQGESLLLARNPHYTGRFEGNLEKVELSFAPSARAVEAYGAGRLDVFDLDFAPPVEMDRMRYEYPDEYLSVPELSTYYLRYDLSRPPFHDRCVRRAFAMAMDRVRLTDVVLRGQVYPATGGQVPPDIAGHSPGIALPYDPANARALLAEAGYPDGRGLPEVELLLARGYEAVVDDLRAQWQTNLGVVIIAKTMAWASLLERARQAPPHILGIGSAAHYPDPATFVGPTRRDEEHPAYVWHDARYDELVAETLQAPAHAERLRLYQQIDRLEVEEAWLVPLWYGRRHLLVKPWVIRLPTSPILGCFWKDVVVEPH
jgi:oligopeptide transport system substrate-binding protein